MTLMAMWMTAWIASPAGPFGGAGDGASDEIVETAAAENASTSVGAGPDHVTPAPPSGSAAALAELAVGTWPGSDFVSDDLPPAQRSVLSYAPKQSPPWAHVVS